MWLLRVRLSPKTREIVTYKHAKQYTYMKSPASGRAAKNQHPGESGSKDHQVNLGILHQSAAESVHFLDLLTSSGVLSLERQIAFFGQQRRRYAWPVGRRCRRPQQAGCFVSQDAAVAEGGHGLESRGATAHGGSLSSNTAAGRHGGPGQMWNWKARGEARSRRRGAWWRRAKLS